MTSESLGVDKIDVVGVDKAERSVTIIQNAMAEVNQERSKLGAFENEYTRTVSRLDDIKYNTRQAEDVIRNADIAQEMINYTQNQLLTNTSAAMLAHANVLPKNIWELLFSQ
jgi:flagellin